MAGKRTIGATIALDGEKQFNAAVSSCSKALETMNSRLKLIETESTGQANSLEALKKKHEVLTEALEKRKEKEEKVQEGLQHALTDYERVGKELDEYRKNLEEAKKALEEMEKSGSSAETELEEQRDKVDALSEAVGKGEDVYRRAGDRVEDWQRKLYDAKTDTEKANTAVDENSRLMEEAEESADGCAKSIDKFGDKMQEADGKTGSLSLTLGTMVKNKVIDLAGDAMQNLASKAWEGLQKAVEVGSQFEAQMSKVGAISGASRSDMERLTQKAAKMGRTTKFSASEAGEGLEYMAMAGWKTDEMLDGLEGIMNLAAASGEDLGTASDIVTDALSAFGLEAKDSSHFADVLATASSNANTNVSTMGETFKYAAPIAGTLGYSVEDTAEAIGLMANAGIKGSQAGTSLRTIMTNLTGDVKIAGDSLGEVTIATSNADGSMRDLSDILDDCRGAFSQLSESEKAQAAETLVGKNAMSGFLTLMDASPESIGQLRTALSEADGAAAGMAERMQDNLAGKVTEFNSALEGLGIGVFTYISGPAQGIVEAATTAINKITDAITPQKTAMDEFLDSVKQSNSEVNKTLEDAKTALSGADTQVADLEYYKKVLMECNGQTDEFSKFQVKKIVEELAGTIPELSEAYDEQTGTLKLTNEQMQIYFDKAEAQIQQEANFEARKKAYEALAEAQLNLAKAQVADKEAQEELAKWQEENPVDWSAIEQGLMTTGSGYYEVASRAGESSAAVKEANDAVQKAQEIIDITDEALKNMDEQMLTTAETTGTATEQIAEATDTNGSGVVEDVDLMKDAWVRLSEEEQAGAALYADSVTSMLNTTREAISSQMDMFEEFSTGTEISTETLLSNMQSQIDGVTNWEQNLSELADKGVNQHLLQYLMEMGPKGANYVASFNSMTAEELAQANTMWEEKLNIEGMTNEWGTKLAESGAQAIRDGMGSVNETLNTLTEESGENTAVGLARGIKEKKAEVEEAAKEMGDSIVNSLNESLEIQSPSKKTKQTGTYVVEGVVQGIQEEVASLEEESKGLASVITDNTIDKLTDESDSATNSAQGFAESMGRGISRGAYKATEAVGALGLEIDNLILGLQNAYRPAKDAGMDIATGIGDGLLEQKYYVWTMADEVAKNAVQADELRNAEWIARDAGMNISRGLAEGLLYGESYVRDASIRIARTAIETARAELGVHSPSKVFYDIGENVTEGYIGALQDKEADIGQAISEAFGVAGTDSEVPAGAIVPENTQQTPDVYVYIGNEEFKGYVVRAAKDGITRDQRNRAAAKGGW